MGVAIFHGSEALGPDNAITVPDGCFLTFAREVGYWYAFHEGGLGEFYIFGNKVMELVGNSINTEHLCIATYIVNALNVETQESLGYKVINK